jgi:hypothetical protein
MQGERPSSAPRLRELAAECVALAERTIDLNARAALLMIAQKWMEMANGRVAMDPALDETKPDA